MPHVTVKLYPGRTGEQKKQLAGEIVKDAVAFLSCDGRSVSLAFEEIEPNDWPEKVPPWTFYKVIRYN